MATDPQPVSPPAPDKTNGRPSYALPPVVAPKGKPPFNELSVLFPLLTLYILSQEEKTADNIAPEDKTP
jgi:hypothetical protein